MATLKDIIDEIEIEGTTSDSVFRNKTRFMLTKYARVGLKKLNLTFSTGVRGMNAAIPLSCTIYKTDDFMRFVRAYLINCDGKTIEISRNKDIPESILNYMLDCDGTLLRDCDDTAIYSDCIECNESDSSRNECAVCCGTGKYMSTEMAALLNEIDRYKDSWVKEHKDRFEFSSDLEGMNVVIEYLTNKIDTADECELHVPDEYTEALESFIKWKILEGGQDTMNLSMYYKQQFKTERNKVLDEQGSLSKRDIYAIMTYRN